ncbi:energy-coupling factor transporter transmembrane protein EcfT [bacterium]|nr:energy-coupling factor transporter transmembrane protein EcfT [candidate division CSSED10-310 bacterium]
MVIFIVTTFLTDQGVQFIGITCVFGLTLILSKTSLRIYLRNITLISWLLLFTFLAHLWGKPLLSHAELPQGFSIRGIFVSYDNVFGGLLAVGQLIVVVGWVTILGATASPLELVNAFESLLRPGKRFGLPVHTFSIIALLSIRFIPILFEEGQCLLHAYIARGLDLHRGTIWVRLKNYVLLCVPLLSTMLRRVEHLTVALESRFFHPGVERTSLEAFHMRRIDYFVLTGSLLLLVLVQVMR